MKSNFFFSFSNSKSLVVEQLFDAFRRKDESPTEEHDVNGRDLSL